MDELTAGDILRPFDEQVLKALSTADATDKRGMTEFGHAAEFVMAHLPDHYKNELDNEDLKFAVLMSMVRLSDLELISDNCVVTDKPHRTVASVHFPEKPDPVELPPLDKWVFDQVKGGFDLGHDNAFAMLAERMPSSLLADLSYPVDELGRSWMRLYLNDYFGPNTVGAAVQRADARAA